MAAPGPLSRFIGALLLGCSLWCCQDNSATQTAPPPAKDPVSIPSFNKDSAYHYVEKQVEFGPRVVGSEGHKACRAWLVQKLQSWNLEVTEQEFTADLYTGDRPEAANIIAQINPDLKQRIVLAAHWDTRHIADQDKDAVRRGEPILGADDGGSGVAVLLEIARTIQQNPVDLGIDIVLFDAEDHGQNNDAT
ncbi:MAG: M28 family peptidase, partial [Saprospiraceae bacterium]|nr:M28 family peptidase [Saprospiraceae bacterium]